MLTLDDEDYELLGWGSERLEEAQSVAYVELVAFQRAKSAEYFREYDKTPARRANLRAAWNRYSQSEKGKAAVARRNEKRKGTTYFADYYRAHAEETKARAKAYYWKMKNDPAFKAKRAAQARARYIKKGKTS